MPGVFLDLLVYIYVFFLNFNESTLLVSSLRSLNNGFQ